jgi:methionine-rich copper-binding protein CopC
MRKIIAAALAAELALIVAGPAAQPHAFLDHASPAVGSAVAASPSAVTLWFTQELEPAFSSVTVINQAGQRVDLGNVQVPQGAPAELQVGLRALPPGTYTVSWHVVSVDTHRTEGRFEFSIGQ